MQVVVSMYFATVGAVRMPVWVPHMEAEERLISSVCAMIASSRLVQLHQEGLVLRRPGVRVAHRSGQEIRQRAGMPLGGRIAPMQREADLPQLLPIDLHG